MIPIHSKIDQGLRTHFEKLVNWYGKNELIPVFLENNIFNIYLNREAKSTETKNVKDADHYLAKTSQQSGNGDGRAVRLGNLAQMSKWETKKMRNDWKHKIPESE